MTYSVLKVPLNPNQPTNRNRPMNKWLDLGGDPDYGSGSVSQHW